MAKTGMVDDGAEGRVGKPIHAVIGVRRNGASTWYARRSDLMSNYKGVWSLPSIKFDPTTLPDPADIDAVQPFFDALSRERLGGVSMAVRSHLTSGTSDDNPMGVDVTLHLYDVTMPEEPTIEPRYYVDAAWMTAAEYQDAARGMPCGLCTRLWADHAWLMGWTDRPFVPTAEED